MADPTQGGRFGRQRVLTKTEATALGYQSQGSYPSGLKNVRTYSLRSALYFNATETEYQLFANNLAGSNKWDTNVLTSNSIPNGQALLVHEIRMSLDVPAVGTAFSADQLNAWARFQRNCLYQFGRENAQWDAQFLGSEILPSTFGALNATIPGTESAPVRIGDFIQPGAWFKLRVPVVIGQNTSFNFTASIRAALGATNPLVVAGLSQVVQLRGLLTKMAAV